MGLAKKVVLSAGLAGTVALGAWLVPACQPAETDGPPGVDSGPPPDVQVGTVSYCGDAGTLCCAQPGQSPNPKCDDGHESQCGSSTSCAIQETPSASMPNGCGSTAPTSCEPLAQNPTSGVQSFRMRRLIVVAPSALSGPIVQNSVINLGVDMNEPQCGEKQTGNFSWILSFDRDAGTLKTGGAPPCDIPDTPSCDPFTTGYCFVNKTLTTPSGSPIHVQPITTNIVTAPDGTLQTAPIPSLNIPIYFQGSIITLPIHGGSLQGVSISADGQCIGTINTNALLADCSDNYTECSKWLTAGALSGYITLNEANQVQVVQPTAQTLCSLLAKDRSGVPQTGPGGVSISTCPTDANGNVTDKGDYCSGLTAGTTQGPGGCKDSFWLAATFAASAVNVNDGANTPDCQGGGSEDSGAPTDSGGNDSGNDSGPSDAGPG
jgi:hypothetical protein